MMFVSARSMEDLTEMIKIGTVIYGDSNGDGTGYSYVNSEGNIKVEKSEKEAKYFWLQNNKRIISKSVIAHVRLGTNGGVKKENSHPFLSEEGEIALCHNGIISDYKEVEKELKKEGHKFSSQTDSEILLHSYEKFGNEFIAKLKEAKVSGSATILILFEDGTIAVYTSNGSMKVYENDLGIFGFSTDRIFTAKKEIEIKNGTIYFFKDGKLVNEIEAGDLHERTYFVTGNTFVRYDESEAIERLLVKYLGLEYTSISIQMNPTTKKIKFSAWLKSMEKIKSDKKLESLKAEMKKGKQHTELIIEAESDKFLIEMAKINVKLSLEIRNAMKEAERKQEEEDEKIVIQNGQVMNGFDNLRGQGWYNNWD